MPWRFPVGVAGSLTAPDGSRSLQPSPRRKPSAWSRQVCCRRAGTHRAGGALRTDPSERRQPAAVGRGVRVVPTRWQSRRPKALDAPPPLSRRAERCCRRSRLPRQAPVPAATVPASAAPPLRMLSERRGRTLADGDMRGILKRKRQGAPEAPAAGRPLAVAEPDAPTTPCKPGRPAGHGRGRRRSPTSGAIRGLPPVYRGLWPWSSRGGRSRAAPMAACKDEVDVASDGKGACDRQFPLPWSWKHGEL